MSELEQKYVVLKMDDLVDVDIEALTDHQPLDPGEFFVIRASDVFGAAALYGYAHLLQSALELDRTRSFLEAEEAVHLAELSDALVNLAAEWQSRATKVPD